MFVHWNLVFLCEYICRLNQVRSNYDVKSGHLFNSCNMISRLHLFSIWFLWWFRGCSRYLPFRTCVGLLDTQEPICSTLTVFKHVLGSTNVRPTFFTFTVWKKSLIPFWPHSNVTTYKQCIMIHLTDAFYFTTIFSSMRLLFFLHRPFTFTYYTFIWPSTGNLWH